MALVDAAEYARSPEAKAAEAAAMAYQAANPSTSSSRPQANDPNSAAYRKSSSAPDSYGAPAAPPSSSSPDFSAWAEKNTALWYQMNPSDQEAWRKAGSNIADLNDSNYLQRLRSQGIAAPQTAISSMTMDPATGQGQALNSQYVPANNQTMPTSILTGQPVTTATNPAANPATNGNENAQSYINSIAAAQQAAAMAALGKSRDAAMSNLGAEKAAIAPKFTEARTQVATGAQQAARNFAEFMANRGGTSGGVAAQAQLSNSAAQQSSLGALGRDETAAFTDIGRRTTDVGNAYESDVASSTAAAEGEKMKLLLQDYYTAQQRGDTQAQQSIQNKIAEAQLQVQQAMARLQEQGQNQAQFNADRNFNRGSLESDRAYNAGQNQNQFNNNLATDAVAYKKEQDARNATAAAAETAEKQRQNNIALAQWGVQTFGFGEPKADAGVFFEQYAGVQPIVAQKLAAEVAQMGFDAAIKQALADNTISKTQADMINDQAQIKIQQQNASTSARSASNASTNASNSQSNSRINQLMDVWKASGKAPAGLESIGVQPGSPYVSGQSTPKATDYKSDPNFAEDVAHLKNNAAAASDLNKNAQAFINAYGYEGYLALRKESGIDKEK